MAYFYLSMHNYSQTYKLSSHAGEKGKNRRGFFWQRGRSNVLFCFGFIVG